MGGEPRRDSSEEQNAPAHEDLVRGLAHVRPRSEGDPSLGHPSLGDVSLGQQGRCAVWGVLNVTPDSFSDGGDFLDVDAALAHAARMIEEGADVIDVGGESSRPPGKTYGAGAARVSVDEELRRVVPVIERLRAAFPDTPVSVDTVKAEVAAAALDAGAVCVNDVSCGASEALVRATAERDGTLVLMHTRDGGRVDAETCAYGDVVSDVLTELRAAAERAIALGVAPSRVWIDPGVGFAKNAAQSVTLLGNLDAFAKSGYPVLVGASRKSWIARTVAAAGGGEPAPDARLGGSLAAVTAAALAGCAAVRVHDVFASAQAARVADAMREAGAR